MTLTFKESVSDRIRRISRLEKIKNSFVFVSILASLAVLSTPSQLIAETETPVEVKKEIVLVLDSEDLIQSNYSIPQIIPGESALQKAEREAREKVVAEAKQKVVVAKGGRAVISYDALVEIYARAGAAFGVDPRLLEAIHQVETGKSGSTGKSSFAGATGPMQFLPSTFRHYGIDGNGDGIKDITNVEDAVFAAANYLKACGYSDVKKALWGYNPSQSYYNKVTSVARSIGMPI